MSAIWHDHGMPSFLGVPPSFSFHELAEVIEFAPIGYEVAMMKLREADLLHGEAWIKHNAKRAYYNYRMKRAWYCTFI